MGVDQLHPDRKKTLEETIGLQMVREISGNSFRFTKENMVALQ